MMPVRLGVFTGTSTVTKHGLYSSWNCSNRSNGAESTQQEGGSAAGISPCNTFNWGAVEDYRINITTFLDSCINPSNILISDLTASGGLISWNSNIDDYTIEYGLKGFTQGTGNVFQTNYDSIFLQGLTHNTEYEFYIKGNCPFPDSNITWIGPILLKTALLPEINFNSSQCLDCSSLNVSEYFTHAGDSILVVNRTILDSMISI